MDFQEYIEHRNVLKKILHRRNIDEAEVDSFMHVFIAMNYPDLYQTAVGEFQDIQGALYQHNENLASFDENFKAVGI